MTNEKINYIHENKIKRYEKEIKDLEKKILKLQLENEKLIIMIKNILKNLY